MYEDKEWWTVSPVLYHVTGWESKCDGLYHHLWIIRLCERVGSDELYHHLCIIWLGVGGGVEATQFSFVTTLPRDGGPLCVCVCRPRHIWLCISLGTSTYLFTITTELPWSLLTVGGGGGGGATIQETANIQEWIKEAVSVMLKKLLLYRSESSLYVQIQYDRKQPLYSEVYLYIYIQCMIESNLYIVNRAVSQRCSKPPLSEWVSKIALTASQWEKAASQSGSTYCPWMREGWPSKFPEGCMSEMQEAAAVREKAASGR